MITSIEEFSAEWKAMSDGTRKMMKALTDESLSQSVAEDHRTLGRMAWHIVTTIPEIAGNTGLKIEGSDEKAPVPASAKEIKESYDAIAKSLQEQIENEWTNDLLEKEDEMYGETWKRGFTLKVLMDHEIHHRGQMTVLMRQAGLKVPGIYGPSYEEWKNYGMEAPAV